MIRLLACVLSMSLIFFEDGKAADCPPDAKSCKVIVVTPEQEQLLVQMIENTNVQGPYAQIAMAVKFFVDLIAKAPAGDLPKPPAPPAAKKP